MIPVSIIVPTKNEEIHIKSCLDALKDYAEVLLIDSNSSDNTVKIANAYNNVKVINFDWDHKHPKKRQWALENVEIKNDWVLFIDADEIFNDNINAEIQKAIQSNKSGFYLTGDVTFLGKRMKHGRKHSKLSLFRKSCGYFEQIDENHKFFEQMDMEIHNQPIIKGKVGRIKHRYFHNNKTDIFDLINKHNLYSSWQISANGNLYGQGIRYLLKMGLYKLPFKSFFIFIDSYILHLGFLDGVIGYNYARFRACYYWQINLKVLEKKLLNIDS